MKKSFTQFIGGGKFSLVSIILFLIALLPSKGWAQSSYTGESGVVLTYVIADADVVITGMTTEPSDGKLVIPGEIEGIPVYKIANNAFSNKGINYVLIPASVTKIDTYTFANCNNLTQVIFEKGIQLQTIPANAFNNTKIKDITIPESITKIDRKAFDNCSDLTTITMLSKTPCTLYSGLFDWALTSKQLTIYVPADAVEAYKTASRWSKYADFIKASAPTSISHTTTSASATSAAIYTLDGRLASKDGNTQALANGIYVQNGKKVVIGK